MEFELRVFGRRFVAVYGLHGDDEPDEEQEEQGASGGDFEVAPKRCSCDVCTCTLDEPRAFGFGVADGERTRGGKDPCKSCTGLRAGCTVTPD